jgi:ATP adenylyltransferase
MSSKSVCRFCSISAGQTDVGPVDTPIMQTPDFFAIASIGAFVEGWTLMVPREHVYSMRSYYPDSEFTEFRKQVVDRVESVYGPAIMFEHGANHCGSQTGCGTDHAHLHIVPANFPLDVMLENSGVKKWARARASEINENADGNEYLFLSTNPKDEDPIGYFTVVKLPISQFFRKAIASTIGKLSVSDYKLSPCLESSLKTQEKLLVA